MPTKLLINQTKNLIMAKTPDHIIVISATTAKPHPLTITEGTTSSTTEDGDENFTTVVEGGQTVQWQIDPESDISGISAITVSSPFFAPKPKANNDWIGKVGNSNGKGVTDTYDIQYSVTKAPSNPYTQDPKMQMKP